MSWKHTKESRLKMSLAHKGKKLPLEQRLKMSLAHKGKKKPWVKGFHGKHTMESKDKMRLAKIGKKHSEERRKRKSDIMPKGKRHYAWKGGVSPTNKLIRHSLEYRLWREAVFKRDNYTCVWCRDHRGGNLEADHIKPFAYYPELRFAIDNGRTLCISCHKTTDTYGSRVNNLKMEPLN